MALATAQMSDAPRDWDGRSYDAVANPQAQWGLAVLDRISLRCD